MGWIQYMPLLQTYNATSNSLIPKKLPKLTTCNREELNCTDTHLYNTIRHDTTAMVRRKKRRHNSCLQEPIEVVHRQRQHYLNRIFILLLLCVQNVLVQSHEAIESEFERRKRRLQERRRPMGGFNGRTQRTNSVAPDDLFVNPYESKDRPSSTQIEAQTQSRPRPRQSQEDTTIGTTTNGRPSKGGLFSDANRPAVRGASKKGSKYNHISGGKGGNGSTRRKKKTAKVTAIQPQQIQPLPEQPYSQPSSSSGFFVSGSARRPVRTQPSVQTTGQVPRGQPGRPTARDPIVARVNTTMREPIFDGPRPIAPLQPRGPTYGRVVQRYRIDAPEQGFGGNINDFFSAAVNQIGVNGGGQDGAFGGGPPVMCQLDGAPGRAFVVGRGNETVGFSSSRGFFTDTRNIRGDNSPESGLLKDIRDIAGIRNSGQRHTDGFFTGSNRESGPRNVEGFFGAREFFSQNRRGGRGVGLPRRIRGIGVSRRFRGSSFRDALSSVECFYGVFPETKVVQSRKRPPTTTTMAPTISSAPSFTPSVSLQPSVAPTSSPSMSPTTATPTNLATEAPTLTTEAPTVATLSPTAATVAPTISPTATPTSTPTAATASPTVTATTASPTAAVTTASPTIASTTSSPTVAATTTAPTAAPSTLTPAGGPTMAPTIEATNAPTMAPSIPGTGTEAPTIVSTTETPTLAPTISPTVPVGLPAPEGTVGVIVMTMLEYGYFDDFEFRSPTQDEIDGLITQTNAFYLERLMTTYDNVEDFQSDVLEWSYDADAEYQVTIDIDANVFFREGTDIPSTREILNVMAQVNYMEYITDFVWNSEPVQGNAFSNVMAVMFNARVDPL